MSLFRSLCIFLCLFTFFIAGQTMATADNTIPSKSRIHLPKEKPSRLSPDGKALAHGTPIKALILDPTPKAFLRRVPSAVNLQTAAATASATFSITYVPDGGTDTWGTPCIAFPEEAKNVFNAAANIWANIISSNVPVAIEACWADLGILNPVLGSTGGGPLNRNFSGSGYIRPDTWYGSALANAMHGADLNPNDPDMYITYNSNYYWYYGTDGETPANAIDLLTVVLHEIAHGLNFSGSMKFSSQTGEGSWGYGTGDPNIYDVLIKDGSGRQLIDTTVYPVPSIALANALRSDDIWFHGTAAMAENNRQPVKVYAPDPWSPGSSYSHLDDTTFADTPNALMVYAIGKGESIHDPGGVTRGLLRDLGWPLAVNQPDLVISHSSVSATTMTANQPFTILATEMNQGIAQADSTAIRYYLSSNSTISTADTELAVQNIMSLAAGTSSVESVSVNAPDTDGTYWYGACIDAVANESIMTNQCSSAVMITVATPNRPNLTCSIALSDTTLTPGQPFTIQATVVNLGMGTADATTIGFKIAGQYFATEPVRSLGPGAMLRITVQSTAPLPEDRYYFSAWIDPVVNESNNIDNFSNEVSTTVSNQNGLPVAITDKPTSIDTLTATGNGTITSLGDTDIIQHGVCWSIHWDPTTNDTCTSQGPLSQAGSFTSSMNGLSFNTWYTVRAYATNSFGTAYGLNKTFRTRNPEMPTVTTNSVTDITINAATGHGTITSLGEASLTQHGLCWGTNWNPTTDDTCTSQGTALTEGSFSNPLPGLRPGTTYSIRAYVTNIYGTVYGNTMSFTTEGKFPWKLFLQGIFLRSPTSQSEPE